MLRIASVVVGLVVVLAAGRAEACSCRGMIFAFEGTGIPRNAKLPLLGSSFSTDYVRLMRPLNPGTELVPIRLESLARGVLVVPEAALEANATYVLESDGFPFAFETGDESDLLAPQAPRIVGFSRTAAPLNRNSSCDTGGEQFVVTVESGEPVERFEVLEVFVGPRPDAIDVSAPALVLPHRDGFVIGDLSACSSNFKVSTLPELAVQVRARDAAGNVSELSNAVQLKSGGCSAAGSALGLGWAVLAFVRTRRRRA